MTQVKRCAVVTILAAIITLHVLCTNSYSAQAPPDGLVIGRDHNYKSNVTLYKDSIISFDKNIRTATYAVSIDTLTEEYTADYNCSNKTVHIFNVAVKNSTDTLEEKRLYINEKVARGSMDGRLLNAVCEYKGTY